MSDRTFDHETLLDLSVNVIPLGIIAFFFVLYAVVVPFPNDALIITVQMSILLLTGIGLAILTYFSGKAIADAETDEQIPPGYSPRDAEVAPSPEATEE